MSLLGDYRLAGGSATATLFWKGLERIQPLGQFLRGIGDCTDF